MLVSASYEMGNAVGLFIRRLIYFFFAPNTTAQHYDPRLTVVHCGYKQSGVSFFCWVICKVVEKENVEDVRHLMEPKPQSNTIHQHMSYKTAADKTILVPTNQQLEFKVCKSPNCTHRLSSNLKMPR